MSETTLEQLRTRERDMELEAIALRARVEELRAVILLLEHAELGAPRRRKRSSDSSDTNVTVVNRSGMPWDDEETAA